MLHRSPIGPETTKTLALGETLSLSGVSLRRHASAGAKGKFNGLISAYEEKTKTSALGSFRFDQARPQNVE